MKAEKIVEEKVKVFTPFSIKITFESQNELNDLLSTLRNGMVGSELYHLLCNINWVSK